jgi:hypothetical protein
MSDMSDQPSLDPMQPTPKKPNNRRTIFLILILAFFACGACGIFSVFFVDDDSTTNERTAELAQGETPTESDVDPTDEPAPDPTEVSAAKPTTEPTATAAPTDTPSPTDTPEPTFDTTIYVTGLNITLDDIPQGEPGLSIVLAGPPSRFGAVPVVVRNNTDEPVYDIKISATARDEAGSVLGTGPGDDFAPSYLPPGGIAFGRVLFGETPLDGATIEYLITGDDTTGLIFSNRDLEVIEHNLVSGNVVGLMLNNHDTPVELINVAVICFDDAGIPTTIRDSYTDQDRVEAGAELPFSVDLLGDEAQCGRYFITGGGWRSD